MSFLRKLTSRQLSELIHLYNAGTHTFKDLGDRYGIHPTSAQSAYRKYKNDTDLRTLQTSPRDEVMSMIHSEHNWSILDIMTECQVSRWFVEDCEQEYNYKMSSKRTNMASYFMQNISSSGILPDPPYALIRVAVSALSDLEKAHGLQRLQTHVKRASHVAPINPLINAIIVTHLGTNTQQILKISNYPDDQHRLEALQHLSQGNVADALQRLDIQRPNAIDATYDITPYIVDPDYHKKDLRDLADRLQDVLYKPVQDHIIRDQQIKHDFIPYNKA